MGRNQVSVHLVPFISVQKTLSSVVAHVIAFFLILWGLIFLQGKCAVPEESSTRIWNKTWHEFTILELSKNSELFSTKTVLSFGFRPFIFQESTKQSIL